jgi:ATP-dependent DNA helicase RecG
MKTDGGFIMDQKELKLFIEEGEGLTIEFKEKYTSKIVQDIVAFANSKGGKIILGVTDEGKINGEKLTGQLKAEIFSLGRNCDPEIEVSVKQIEGLVVVDVAEGDDKPYSCSGTYYKRFDAVTQKLNRNETKAIFDSNSSSQFDEKPNTKAKLSDLSLTKVRAFYKTAGIKYKVTQENLPNILKSLNLMESNRISNVGVLFFAEKMDHFFLHSQIMMLAFKDYVGATIFDRKEIRGDLITQFNEAEFFMTRHLSLQAIIESTRRRNVYEIPEEAWREAIANAIIHRDYKMGGTSIQVRIFPDRVEVISPGRLPKGVTAKNIGEMSSRRNEVIADMFSRMDVVEKAGTGIIRIREAMKREGLPPPVFEDMGEFFKIILYRPKGVSPDIDIKKSTQKKYLEKVPSKSTLKLGKTAQKVLDLIAGNSQITTSDLAANLEITADAVKKHLSNLKKKDLIRRIGPDKGGHWEVIE